MFSICNSIQHKENVSPEIGFFWLKIVTSGGLLWTRQWNWDLCITWDRSESSAEINFSRMTLLLGVNKLQQQRTTSRHQPFQHFCR